MHSSAVDFRFWFFLALGLAMAFLVSAFVIAGYVRSRVMKKDRMDAPRCCAQCGYNLTGYRMPRCPECGAAVGFTKTFEQLGVDEQQVIQHVEGRGLGFSHEDPKKAE